MTLAQYQADITPLHGRWGTAWALAVGASKDVELARAQAAVFAGSISRCTDDAVPLLGADALLEQLPGESIDSFRSRIVAAWDTWRWAGTRTAILTVLDQLGGALWTSTAVLTTAHALGVTPWAQWFAFVGPGIYTRRTWGSPEQWGAGVWGSSASRDDVRRARRLLRRFSNARDVGWLVIRFSAPGVWGAPAKWGTGTWSGRNARWRI